MSWKIAIKKNVLLYRFWLFAKQNLLKQMQRVRLPNENDDFYLDGYPRSGNTFCVSFIGRFYSEKKFAHHLHSISGYKIAFSKKLECYALFRDPLESIASLAIMQDFYGRGDKKSRNFLFQNVKEYISYYEYLISNKERIQFIEFKTIVDVFKIKDFFEEKIHKLEVKDEDLIEFERNFKNNQKNKPSQRTSSPNENRNKEKKEIKSILINLPNYSHAKKLFEEMKKMQ